VKITTINQIPFGQLDSEYDLMICASGYESRAIYVAEALLSRSANKVNGLVLAFDEHKEILARPQNDKFFEKFRFESKICIGASTENAEVIISEKLHQLKRSKPSKILVDISSMTRAWYGAVVKCLTQLTELGNLEVHFTYTPAEYNPPSENYPPNRVVCPVRGFSGNTFPDVPTALVIGLGYDPDRALGLKEYLDPQLTFLFIPDPSTDARYLEKVKNVNSFLLGITSSEQKAAYPVLDMVSTFKLLESTCNGLKRNWRVVLCSFGPKTFGLCCFLVASIHRDLSIWRVGADHHEKPINHKPGGDPLVLRTSWRG